jgi:hypothetical protein
MIFRKRIPRGLKVLGQYHDRKTGETVVLYQEIRILAKRYPVIEKGDKQCAVA